MYEIQTMIVLTGCIRCPSNNPGKRILARAKITIIFPQIQLPEFSAFFAKTKITFFRIQAYNALKLSGRAVDNATIDNIASAAASSLTSFIAEEGTFEVNEVVGEEAEAASRRVLIFRHLDEQVLSVSVFCDIA